MGRPVCCTPRRFGLPIPRPEPLFCVSGKAIPVPKVSRDDPDFDKHVEALHAKVVDELQVGDERC